MTLYTPRPHVRVLGVDPGLTRCGLGVVDGVPGRPPSLVAVGVVRTAADVVRHTNDAVSAARSFLDDLLGRSRS